jgi:hypothetical protein
LEKEHPDRFRGFPVIPGGSHGGPHFSWNMTCSN